MMLLPNPVASGDGIVGRAELLEKTLREIVARANEQTDARTRNDLFLLIAEIERLKKG